MIRIGSAPDGMKVEEVNAYLKQMQHLHPEIKNGRLDIEPAAEQGYVHATLTEDSEPPFQRIRRITGYLVGGLERWNNAKLHELGDREKHVEI